MSAMTARAAQEIGRQVIEGAEHGHGLVMRRVADIEARPIRWLWPGRIARGKVTLIAGHPGLGKSQLGLTIVATVTTAGAWPVDGMPAERGAAIVMSAEDDAADTIRPRLEAAGADLSRVHVVDAVQTRGPDGKPIRRGFSLADDLPRLSAALEANPGVAVVVIDPVTAFLGNTDSHRNSEVRALMAPLADLAARHGVAIIAVTHLRKSAEGDALLKVSGSLAFVAAARSAYVVAKDPQDESRRLLLPIKNNIGPDATGYAFRVESIKLQSGIDTSRIVFELAPVVDSADDALAPGGTDGARGAVESAVDFLRDLLAGGPVNVEAIRTEAKAAGHSWSSVQRAKGRLGLGSRKSAMAGAWSWSFPGDEDNGAETL